MGATGDAITIARVNKHYGRDCHGNGSASRFAR